MLTRAEGRQEPALLGSNLFAQQPRDFVDVFVASAGEADHDDVVLAALAGGLEGLSDRVRAFDGGQNAFELCQRLERGESFVVADVDVAHSAGVFPVAVLRADAGIVEASGDRMHRHRLAVGILQDVAVAAVQDSLVAEAERAGVIAGSWPTATCFDAS